MPINFSGPFLHNRQTKVPFEVWHICGKTTPIIGKGDGQGSFCPTKVDLDLPGAGMFLHISQRFL